jgi:hypothetical protein
MIRTMMTDGIVLPVPFDCRQLPMIE